MIWRLSLPMNLLLLLVLATAGCSKKDVAPAEEKKSAEPESRVKRNASGEVIITLDTETQKRVGLETGTLAATQLAPEIRAVGRVLEPAGVSSLVADFISARATAEASAKELERSKPLLKSDNISARSYQTAEANAARDSAQLEAARAKLIGALGSELAARENLVELTKSLTSGASALVRLDLPLGEAPPGNLSGAQILALREGSKWIEAKFAGATAVDSPSQTRGLLFFIESNGYGFTAGESVTGSINGAGAAQAGVVIPGAAVVRKDGVAWVYVQTADGEFTRREISTERPVDGGSFVTRGVAAGDKIVTVGAQQLLSEELKGQSAE